MFVASGEFRPSKRFAETDVLVWQPRVGLFLPFRNIYGHREYHADFTGRLYSPLILLQQNTLSRSIRTVQADGSEPSPRPRLPRRNQLHPVSLKELPPFEKALGLTWDELATRFSNGGRVLPQ